MMDAQYSKRQRKNAACQKEELTHASGDEVIEYKWRETGDGVYLDCLGDKADLKFTDDGPDKLKTTIMFFVTLTFKRIK